MKLHIIQSHPDILGGTPVFRGTRVPIQVLFDCIQYDSLDDFFEGYPHITREMVNDVFDFLRTKILVKQRKQTLYENFA